MKFSKESNILIVGLGLIGGSYALALSRAGYRVSALDTRPEAIAFAREKRWIKAGQSEATPDFLGQFDLVIFALYPHIFLSWIKENQKHLKPGALLTDVTGVKGAVADAVQQMLRPDLEFIGAHPMAGREKSGVEHAAEVSFADANYIVTPTERNTKEAVEACRALGHALGFARVAELSPKEHDKMVGFLSQLTHCIAVALMTSSDNPHLAEYTGDSFRDLTRIASINDEMWSELFLWNKEELLCQMDTFAAEFEKLRNAVAAGDREELRRRMRLSSERRAIFDKDGLK